MSEAPKRIWVCDSGIWFSDDQGEPGEYDQYHHASTLRTILDMLNGNASRENIIRVIEAELGGK